MPERIDQTANVDAEDVKRTAGELLRTTVREWQELDRRFKAGEKLSDNELKEYNRIKEMHDKAVQAISRNLGPAFEKLQAFAKQMQEVVLPKIPPFLEQIGKWQEAFHKLPPRLQEALSNLADNGWHIDMCMPFSDIWKFEELLINGHFEAVDEMLIKHFEEQLDEIEERLVLALPSRQRILRSAFRAHRRGEFELSVPVFLSQSDGAWHELTKFYFFTNDELTKKPGPVAYLESLVGDEMQSIFLAPLRTPKPIFANPKQREKILQNRNISEWKELNRHIVLHGESVDYGTQINSLKAISFINYLVEVVSDDANKIECPKAEF